MSSGNEVIRCMKNVPIADTFVRVDCLVMRTRMIMNCRKQTTVNIEEDETAILQLSAGRGYLPPRVSLRPHVYVRVKLSLTTAAA